MDLFGEETAGRQEIASALSAIRAQCSASIQAAVILGTGSGNLAQAVQDSVRIPYGQLPGFPATTALSHAGQLVLGRIEGLSVAILEGRWHVYEGYHLREMALPLMVLRELGAEVLIVSNASGGLNPLYRGGDLMVMEGHINLLGKATTLGPRLERGTMHYDPELIEWTIQLARSERIPIHQGVYAALAGPNYETRSEYRALRRMGADVVGMSTVPEALVAAALGMRVLGLSIVTNVARPDAPQSTTAQEVVDIAQNAEPKLRTIVSGILRRLS